MDKIDSLYSLSQQEMYISIPGVAQLSLEGISVATFVGSA